MGVPREQVGYPDTRQDEDRSSCEVRGKNVIPYTHMNVVAVLPSVEMHECSFCDTLDIVRSHEDQTLVVGTQALVDPLDDKIDSPRENDLCPSGASTYNLTKVPLPSDESIHTLVDPCEKQGESTLICELPITSEDDFDYGPLASRDDLYVCEDKSYEREGDIYLEMPSTSSLCAFYVGHIPSGNFETSSLDSRSNPFQEGKDDTSQMATLIFEDMIGEEATETALQSKFKGKMQMQEEGTIPETSTFLVEIIKAILAMESRRVKTFLHASIVEKSIIKRMIVVLRGRNHLSSVDIAINLVILKGSVKLADKTKLDIVGKGTVAIEAPKGCSFTVTRDVNVEQLGRETNITLLLKEDQLEYLEELRMKDLIKKQSEFISYPVYLWAERKKSVMMKMMSPRKMMRVQVNRIYLILHKIRVEIIDLGLIASLTVTGVRTLLPQQLQLVGKWGKLLLKNLLFP
ncbi:hypothetical protein FXO38_04501 [Capsicum annuum]|nr:hypothetical protein FXO38_04501 [Capsicum annuum]